MKNKLIGVFMVVIIALFAIFLKVYLSSRMEYRKAEAALQQQKYHKAITHYERSIQWYTPGSRYVSAAAQKMWQIGELAKNQGKDELALEAYESLRSSFYAVRSFYTPYREWIARCDEKIASLVAAKGPTVKRDIGKSYAQRKAEYLKLLKKDEAPNVVWSFVLEAGFIGWIGSTIAFIFQAFGRDGSFYNKRALFWGSLIIAFYALWIIGMLKA
jgi:hypothetical protein